MAGKGKKIVGGVLAVLLILIAVLLCVFFFWLGPTVKLVAEKVGSKALGTPLTVEELSINPRHGTVHMKGFAIANHEEFGITNAVSLAGLDIEIDVGSIFTPTVIVHKLQIDSPYFVYEQNSASDNITEFIKNIEEYLGPDEAKKEKDEPDGKEPKVVVVEQMELNDVQFHLANTDDPLLDINAGFEQLAVSMTNGTVMLKNVHISNPGLLDSPNLFTLDGISIALDPASIYSDTVVIRDVQVIHPYAYLERNAQTDTVSEFMKIAATFADTGTNAPTEPITEMPAEPEPAATEDTPPPFELHNLLVDDIQIKLLDTSTTNAMSEPRMLAGIGSISVKLVDGKIQIKEIRVPNPEGYQTTNLFQLANIDIAIDPASIFSSQTIIQQVLVNNPEINLEQTETSGNIADLQALLMGFVPPAGATEGVPSPKTVPQTGERMEPIPLNEQSVVLLSLEVTNFAIRLTQPAATNEPPKWAMDLSQIGNLNPLDKMGAMNPFAEKKAEPEETPDDGPLKLVYFDNLLLQPLDGVLQINGLGVANPPGYANANLVKLNQFRIELDPDTLQSDVLLIRDILIDTPRIAYERQITTDNLKTMQEEIEKATGKTEETTDAESTQTDEKTVKETSDGQKVIIDHLLVKNGQAKAKLSIAPSLPIPLPDIEMRDIGKETGGTTVVGAITEIGTTIYDTLIGAVSGATGFAGDALKGFGALTLGTLGDMADGESESDEQKDLSQTEGMQHREAAEQPSEKNPATSRKRRRRMPGRSF